MDHAVTCNTLKGAATLGHKISIEIWRRITCRVLPDGLTFVGVSAVHPAVRTYMHVARAEGGGDTAAYDWIQENKMYTIVKSSSQKDNCLGSYYCYLVFP